MINLYPDDCPHGPVIVPERGITHIDNARWAVSDEMIHWIQQNMKNEIRFTFDNNVHCDPIQERLVAFFEDEKDCIFFKMFWS